MSHKSVECREPSCRARVVFLQTRNGSKMPVDAETVLDDDVVFDPPRHVSHFKTCKKPNRFGRSNRK